MKQCRKCGEMKALSAFNKAKGNRDGLTGSCKTCIHKRWKSWYEDPSSEAKSKNAERNRHRSTNVLSPEDRRAKSLRRYGLTYEEYVARRNKFDNLCEVCQTRSSVAVDHDHVTGKVRGILCHQCNQALGLMLDRSDILRRAIEYLNKPA